MANAPRGEIGNPRAYRSKPNEEWVKDPRTGKYHQNTCYTGPATKGSDGGGKRGGLDKPKRMGKHAGRRGNPVSEMNASEFYDPERMKELSGVVSEMRVPSGDSDEMVYTRMLPDGSSGMSAEEWRRNWDKGANGEFEGRPNFSGAFTLDDLREHYGGTLPPDMERAAKKFRNNFKENPNGYDPMFAVGTADAHLDYATPESQREHIPHSTRRRRTAWQEATTAEELFTEENLRGLGEVQRLPDGDYMVVMSHAEAEDVVGTNPMDEVRTGPHAKAADWDWLDGMPSPTYARDSNIEWVREAAETAENGPYSNGFPAVVLKGSKEQILTYVAGTNLDTNPSAFWGEGIPPGAPFPPGEDGGRGGRPPRRRR